jgi:hypothetical protein
MGVYDKTLREIFNNVPVTLIKTLTGRDVKKLLNSSFPSVKEREADFLVMLDNNEIFHLEIQSINDKNMPRRMLLYALMIEEIYKKFPIQAVLFVGNSSNKIDNKMIRENLSYQYKVYDIKEINCKDLLLSDSIEDNILSILCKIEDENYLLDKIILKVLNLDESKRADYLRKLIILARLRPKLYNKIENFFKEKKMPIVFDTKNDPLYHKGWNEAWNEAWNKAEIESTINTAIMMIKEFNLPISEVAKKLNIDVNVLQKALNDTK